VRQNQNFLRENLGHNLRRFTTRLELYPGAEVIEEMRSENLLAEDFFVTLNPFGYRYIDARLQNLATCLNALYGIEYSENCRVIAEPAVFRFETYDIELHNFVSRLRRVYPDNAAGMQILDDLDVQVEAIKVEMTCHNFAIVEELTDRAERDMLQIADAARWAAPIDAFFVDCMRHIDQAKLRCGLRLRRLGIDLSAITGVTREQTAVDA
jgi:hypothetical protein